MNLFEMFIYSVSYTLYFLVVKLLHHFFSDIYYDILQQSGDLISIVDYLSLSISNKFEFDNYTPLNVQMNEYDIFVFVLFYG